jgi:hypothetical protein
LKNRVPLVRNLAELCVKLFAAGVPLRPVPICPQIQVAELVVRRGTVNARARISVQEPFYTRQQRLVEQSTENSHQTLP